MDLAASPTLAFGVFAASLLGSLHCAGMCGGFACLYGGDSARSDGPRSLLTGHLAYHGGRLMAYATLGALAGALGAGLDRAGELAGVQRSAGWIAGALLVLWGLALLAQALDVRFLPTLVRGQVPERAAQFIGRVLLRFQQQTQGVRAALLGVLTGALPCGWLYAFVVSRQFCCTGCHTAFTILHEHGLDSYYGFAERREAPVRASGRSYEEFDHPAFAQLYVTRTRRAVAHRAVSRGRALRVVCVARRAHAAAAERRGARGARCAPLAGGGRVGRRIAVPLSAIARALDVLGYPPHPFRGVARADMRRREDRAMLVRIGIAGAIAINVMLLALALYAGELNGMEALHHVLPLDEFRGHGAGVHLAGTRVLHRCVGVAAHEVAAHGSAHRDCAGGRASCVARSTRSPAKGRSTSTGSRF
jgi:sulfite exporter TauE/SafE